MRRFLFLLLIPFLVYATSADARRHRVQSSVMTPCSDIGCIMSGNFSTATAYGFAGPTANSPSRGRHSRRSYSDSGTTYLPHPSGCPSRAFCGCGASIEAFGRNIRSLWLARNWYGFPRTAPASGMAMVRSHHVAILRSQISGSVWMVADHNSGGRRSRLHARDIRGWTIVNPHGGNRHASL